MKTTGFFAFITMMLISNSVLANATPTPIPEPNIMVLTLIGVASIGIMKWIKRK